MTTCECGGKTMFVEMHRFPRPRPHAKKPCITGKHVHATCLFCNTELVEEVL